MLSSANVTGLKCFISGIVQAAGLFAHRTKFASIRGTFAMDNPIATTRPMKNQVKLMDFRHGRNVVAPSTLLGATIFCRSEILPKRKLAEVVI